MWETKSIWRLRRGLGNQLREENLDVQIYFFAIKISTSEAAQFILRSPGERWDGS